MNEQIHEVLGLDAEEYMQMEAQFTKEFLDILYAGTHTKAGEKLVEWFSKGDYVERQVKGVVISLMFHKLQKVVLSLLPDEVRDWFRLHLWYIGEKNK